MKQFIQGVVNAAYKAEFMLGYVVGYVVGFTMSLVAPQGGRRGDMRGLTEDDHVDLGRSAMFNVVIMGTGGVLFFFMVIGLFKLTTISH